MRLRATVLHCLRLAAVGFLFSMPLRAQEGPRETGFFTDPKELFPPLMADPREVQLGFRLLTPVGGQNFGEIAAGDYVGLYRWALPWQDAYIQWSIAGGMFSRFELVTTQKGNEVLDYTANMPVDMRVGRWVLRMLPYHMSSHLGDDYIKRTGITTDKFSFDSYKTLVAFNPNDFVRLYAGYNFIMRNREERRGRHAVQAGAEWKSRWRWRQHAQLYSATDFQSWKRTGWNPNVVTQLGVRLSRSPQAHHAICVYGEYAAGRRMNGQFFDQKESHWVAGFRFEHN